MNKVRAQKIESELDTTKPFYSRADMIESIASLCAIYTEEVNRKVQGQNKPVFKILWSACSPDRLEWYLNNIRMRHSISKTRIPLLPKGTTSNEALHAELNASFKQQQQFHQATLRLKLGIILTALQLSHHSAMTHYTLRQLRPAVVLARVAQQTIWSGLTWRYSLYSERGVCSSTGCVDPVPFALPQGQNSSFGQLFIHYGVVNSGCWVVL